MMKRLLAIVMVLVCVCSFALADDDVTIPADKTSKAGTTLTKQDKSAQPQLDVYKIDPGATIKFWIYRNGLAQVTRTYEVSTGNDWKIEYNNSGNMVKGAKYHSVWKKTTQGNVATYIHFAFVP